MKIDITFIDFIFVLVIVFVLQFEPKEINATAVEDTKTTSVQDLRSVRAISINGTDLHFARFGRTLSDCFDAQGQGYLEHASNHQGVMQVDDVASKLQVSGAQIFLHAPQERAQSTVTLFDEVSDNAQIYIAPENLTITDGNPQTLYLNVDTYEDQLAQMITSQPILGNGIKLHRTGGGEPYTTFNFAFAYAYDIEAFGTADLKYPSFPPKMFLIDSERSRAQAISLPYKLSENVQFDWVICQNSSPFAVIKISS